MMCNFCFEADNHRDACPKKIEKIAMDFWNLGWAHGKTGLLPQDLNPTYKLGHEHGLRMRRGESPLD
jgi:hypothetical protein